MSVSGDEMTSSVKQFVVPSATKWVHSRDARGRQGPRERGKQNDESAAISFTQPEKICDFSVVLDGSLLLESVVTRISAHWFSQSSRRFSVRANCSSVAGATWLAPNSLGGRVL